MNKMYKWCIVVGCVVGISVFLGWRVHCSRQAAFRSQCKGILNWLAAGINCYVETYGHLPPVVQQDEQGRALHSWRMLLMESCGPERGCVSQQGYNFDEPWNSTHNLSATADMNANDFGITHYYNCPLSGRSNYSNYLAVTDASGEWLHSENKTDKVLIIVCDVDSKINATVPQDLSLTQWEKSLCEDERYIGIFWDHQSNKAVVIKFDKKSIVHGIFTQ